MKKQDDNNKVHPKDNSALLEEAEADDYGVEVNNSDVERQEEENKISKLNEVEQQNEPIEEPEWRDKMIRSHLDKFMSSIIGEIINKLIGVLSIGSSIAFVVMTYYDWSESDPCCRQWTEVNSDDS